VLTVVERFNLSGKTALVTGASAGLGSHFASSLAAAGAHVIVAARRVEKLQRLEAGIQAAGGKASTLELDVTNPASVSAAFARLGAGVDAVHILVNNAGVALGEAAENINEEDWDRLINTNLKGAWLVAQAFARQALAKASGGSIINITSILGWRVAKGVAPYSASKAALEQLTRSLALEWARHGIRVNAIAPGFFATDLNRAFLQSEAGRSMLQRIPQRRPGSLEELDGALLLLASDASSYMSGSTLVVDGGHLCSSL